MYFGGELFAPQRRTDAIDKALASADPADPVLILRSRETVEGGGVEDKDGGDGLGVSWDEPRRGIATRAEDGGYAN